MSLNANGKLSIAHRTLLKIKRKKTTYILPVEPTSLSLIDLIEKLTEIINNSGGLYLEDPEYSLEEELMAVPRSEFRENDDNDVEDASEGIQVTPEEIAIAFPGDKSNPYNNEWNEIYDDSVLENYSLADYDIVAFKHASDGQFFIEESSYEES